MTHPVDVRTGVRASVVVPTRNEARNAPELLRRMCAALPADTQILFVDDGDDDLPEVVRREAAWYPHDIAVHRRVDGTGGLGGAVVEGMRRTDGDVVVVCDGDLQHPPEVIADLLAAAAAGADVVVASRYRAGGSAAGLSSGFRRLVSRGTGVGSKLLFPLKLRDCTDPMSGFFLVRRSRVDLAGLRPQGFKILLEIVLRSPRMALAEVGYTFDVRVAGESNASVGEAFRFARQMMVLRLWNRAVAYALVGMSGILPNLVVLTALEAWGVHYLVAAVVAVQVAIGWNFVGAELFIWPDRRQGAAPWRRFLLFAAIGETDLLRIPFVVLLVGVVGFSSVAATLTTIAVSFAARYVLADRQVYRRHRPTEPVAEADLDPAVA